MSIARVHTLSCLDEVESSSDTRAAAVIQESCHRAGWQSVWIHDNHLAVTQNSDVDDERSCWTFSKPPPKLKLSKSSVSPSLLKWGIKSTLDEVYETRDLPEFDGFQSVPPGARIIAPSTPPSASTKLCTPKPLTTSSSQRKRTRDIFEEDAQREMKRGSEAGHNEKSSTPPVILSLSTNSKHSNVKRPHYLSAKLLVCQPHCKPIPTKAVPLAPMSEAIRKHVPEFPVFRKIDPPPAQVPPRAPFLAWDAPFARGAWLVPLNGQPLIRSASSACVFHDAPDNLGESASFDTSTLDAPVIRWTASAVSEFWRTLLNVRRKGAFGPVGISLECATAENVACGQGRWQHSSLSSNTSMLGDSEGAILFDAIHQNQEWIKIWCDGEYALRLRNILANAKVPVNAIGSHHATVLGPGDSSAAQQEAKLPLRYKPLRGARLVYVDELHRPLLIA